MDPGSIHLLGFKVDGRIYFDVVLSMGLRIACYIAQRISNAIIYLYKRLSYEGINYIDDLGTCGLIHTSGGEYSIVESSSGWGGSSYHDALGYSSPLAPGWTTRSLQTVPYIHDVEGVLHAPGKDRVCASYARLCQFRWHKSGLHQ